MHDSFTPRYDRYEQECPDPEAPTADGVFRTMVALAAGLGCAHENSIFDLVRFDLLPRLVFVMRGLRGFKPVTEKAGVHEHGLCLQRNPKAELSSRVVYGSPE